MIDWSHYKTRYVMLAKHHQTRYGKKSFKARRTVEYVMRVDGIEPNIHITKKMFDRIMKQTEVKWKISWDKSGEGSANVSYFLTDLKVNRTIPKPATDEKSN